MAAIAEKARFIRVRKLDIQVKPVEKQDGYSLCMDCWKLYMSMNDRDLSASRMQLRGGEVEPVAYESDPYAEQRREDIRIGGIVHVMIHDLKNVEWWAIYKKYGFTTVWNFPRADLLQIIPAAEQNLAELLKKNLETAKFF